MKVSMMIAALMISASAFAMKPAATPAATTPATTATAPAATKMTEADAKKACMTEKAADMTKCVAGKMTPAVAQ